MRLRLLMLVVVAAVVGPAAALGGGASNVALYASMNGAKELPKGDPTATGTAEIKLNAATGKVCWKFTLKGVKGPTAAHIHTGGPGTTGAVIVPFGTAFKRSGCTTAPKETINAILAKPRAFYVNVHTAKYPAGAVRGQLSKTEIRKQSPGGRWTY